VATGNAKKMASRIVIRRCLGMRSRWSSAGPYDVVLVTNFYHHFDMPTCERLTQKIFAALKPGGRCVTLDSCRMRTGCRHLRRLVRDDDAGVDGVGGCVHV